MYSIYMIFWIRRLTYLSDWLMLLADLTDVNLHRYKGQYHTWPQYVLTIPTIPSLSTKPLSVSSVPGAAPRSSVHCGMYKQLIWIICYMKPTTCYCYCAGPVPVLQSYVYVCALQYVIIKHITHYYSHSKTLFWIHSYFSHSILKSL